MLGLLKVVSVPVDVLDLFLCRDVGVLGQADRDQLHKVPEGSLGRAPRLQVVLQEDVVVERLKVRLFHPLFVVDRKVPHLATVRHSSHVLEEVSWWKTRHDANLTLGARLPCFEAWLGLRFPVKFTLCVKKSSTCSQFNPIEAKSGFFQHFFGKGKQVLVRKFELGDFLRELDQFWPELDQF